MGSIAVSCYLIGPMNLPGPLVPPAAVGLDSLVKSHFSSGQWPETQITHQ